MSAASVIERYSREPFEWGRSDCCTFVGECIEADGHENPMSFYRYMGEDGARSAIKMYGDLRSSIVAWLGEPADDVRSGDVALVEYRDETIAGYVVETMAGLRVVVRTTKGVTDWPVSKIIETWRPTCQT